MNKEKQIRVAIYCRVSTTEQAEEGYSIGEQERLLIDYCEQKGYEVYQVYSDAGISGKDIKHRPAMQQLLADATKKVFNMVISWKINRISRKLIDAIKIVETLEKYGIAYHSYSEPFETTTPAGRMQFQMIASFGEYERGTISENVKMGMCAKARAGEWCGGTPPLGYKWIPMVGTENSARKKSMLAIDEREAEIVRHIFELYASGKGYKAIVNQINKEGHKTKKGNAFAIAQVKTILTNPVYIGKVRFNVRRDWNEKRRHNINPNPIIVDGKHQAIIDDELWNKVQSIIAQKSGKPSRIYDGEYPLTGILRCPECGAGMVISRTINKLKNGEKKQLTYYTCGAWKNKGTAVCHSNSIRVEKANAVVFRELEKLFSDERFLKCVLKRVNETNNKQQERAESKLEKCKKEIKANQAKRERIFDAFEEGILSNEDFLERKEKLNQEYNNLVAEKNEALSLMSLEHKKEIPYEVVRDVLQNFAKVLNSDKVDRSLKKQLLHLIISEITLDNRREVESIKIHLTDDVIRFLNNNGETSVNGVSPNLLLTNWGIRSFDLKIAI